MTAVRRILILLPLLASASALRAADSVEVSLAEPRSRFQTAESIELAVLYRNDGGKLDKVPLELKHTDGSTCTVPVPFNVTVGKAQTRIVTVLPEMPRTPSGKPDRAALRRMLGELP